jgi:3-hydroxyacyl-CoA dehydrogenase
MKLGCGYPMGPLTLLDFVGLDTTYYIANIMFDEFREKRFAPRRCSKDGGCRPLRKKSGRGFYDYSDQQTSTITSRFVGRARRGAERCHKDAQKTQK